MKIYLGADHRGFKLKEQIKDILSSQGILFEDLSGKTKNSADDYPQIAQEVAQAVVQHLDARGIIACGSGAGVDIVANKIDGARSVLAISPEQVAASRKDDNTNVLSLAADFTNTEKLSEMISAFLETDYEANERHERRLEQIEQLEHEN